MPTVLDFITNHFKKSGIELTAAMKETLNNPELTKIVLDDDLVKQANEKQMTLEVAKQNPVLKQHFRFETLAPLDTEINDRMIAEYEIPDEFAAPIRAEKNTYERVKLLTATIKQLQEKKATAQVGDKKALIEQIDKLNSEKLLLINTSKLEKEQLIKANDEKELDWNKKGSLAVYNYSKKYGDRADAIALAMIKLDRKLQADGAKVILGTDGLPKLVSAIDPALDFTQGSQKVIYRDYLDKMVADEKMIEVTDKTTPPVNPTLPPVINNNGQNNTGVPARAAFDIDKDLADALKATVN